MDQEWFEMKDFRKKDFNNSVWIPLRKIFSNRNNIEYGHKGHIEEFYGIGTLMFPIKSKHKVSQVDWMRLGIKEHRAFADKRRYIRAEDYGYFKDDLKGVYPVLQPSISGFDRRIWFLNQDIIMALKLIREGNFWLSPEYGYEKVVRIELDQENNETNLEIRNEFLKDYLCARKMGLWMTCFFHRTEISNDVSFLNWESDFVSQETDNLRWEGRATKIHEGGNPYGESAMIMKIERTDFDSDEDVPVLTKETGENTKFEKWERKFSGRMLYRIDGELWKNQLIVPSKKSYIVREDKSDEKILFFVDAEGNKESSESFRDSVGKWLWFKPEVITSILRYRGSYLKWYTRDTGCISCPPHCMTHFGINDIGLINIFAEDIALLPLWQQKIWAGNNVKPEGGVSNELVDSQIKLEPAKTQAPEDFLNKSYNLLNLKFKIKFGFDLFQEHKEIKSLLYINRFESLDQEGFYSLAKKITKLFSETINVTALQREIEIPKGVKWGSLKSLENFLIQKINLEPTNAKSLITPFVGFYELRHQDSHLSSSDLSEMYDKARVHQDQAYLFQGHNILSSFVGAMYELINLISNHK